MITQYEVFKLADQAGFSVEIESFYRAIIWALNPCRFDGECNADVTLEVTSLIELAMAEGAKQEREACAALCIGLMTEETTDYEDRIAVRMAKIIRNRGEPK